jgi:hypothetical protein
MYDEAPDEKRMDEIRAEIAERGDVLLQKLIAGNLTLAQVYAQMEAMLLGLTCGHETTWHQQEELFSYGRQVAVHIREQWRQHKQASGF